MKPIYSVRMWLVAFAAGLLVACGGGGGTDAPPANPPSNPPAGDPMRLVLSSTEVSVQAQVTDTAATRDISVSVQNLPTPNTLVYFSRSHSSNGIQSAQFSSASPATAGTLVVVFKNPASLAPGVYNDTVQVSACLASPCTNATVTGSPATIAITYTVTAPVTPPPGPTPPTLVLSTTAVSVQANAAQAAPTATVLITLQDWTPAWSIYLGGGYSTRGIADLRVSQQGSSDTLLIIFKSPADLPVGVYQDTITVAACTEWPCITHITGSPQVITVSYTVTAPDTVVTFSGTSVSLQRSNLVTRTQVIDRSISMTVTDPMPGQWTRTTISGSVVESATFEDVSQTSKTLVLTLRPPSSLGAGTYTGRVKVELCLNANCSVQAAGSSRIIDVNYQITGDAVPRVGLSWNSMGVVDQTTAETRSPRMTLQVFPSERLYEPIYLRHGASTTGLIESAVLGASPSGTQPGYYNLNLKPPATLGSGLFTDSMEFEACWDAACATPIPNTRYTLTVQMLVTATDGLEYTRRVVQIEGAAEVAWSPMHQSLYVTSNTRDIQRVTQVDPVTMALGASAALPNGTPRRVLPSPDGSYLYVGSFGKFLHRLRLPLLQMDLTIPLGTAPDGFAAWDLVPIPGSPRSVVVAGSNAGVYVYDDATPRPHIVAPDLDPRGRTATWLAPSATPGELLSQSFSSYATIPTTFDRLVVDANGVSRTSSSPMASALAKPQLSGTKLYAGPWVANAATGELLSRLPGVTSHYATLVDEVHGRIFVWANVSNREMVVSYDLATLAVLAYANVATSPSQGRADTSTIMALWGNDGLALVNGGQLVVLSGPFFSTYRGAPAR